MTLVPSIGSLARAMRQTPRMAAISSASVVAAVLLLSGCANPGKSALDTNVPLKAAPDLAGAATPGARVWRSPDIASYDRSIKAYMIPAATVFRGKGSSFADLSPAQVDSIAADLTKEVRAEMGRRFKIVNAAGPGVASIELVVAKIAPPQPNYDQSGMYPEPIEGMPDKNVFLPGTVTISGKIIDSSSSTLLAAFVAPVSPTVMDLPNAGQPARALDYALAANGQFASDLTRSIVRERQNSSSMAPK